MDISIIIPTFNRLWSLRKCVESCRSSLVKTEIIVIDDGSTDGTIEWLSCQKNIVTISQKNQGKDWAVNNGVKIAKGKYVRFLDSDDWILPNSNESLVKIAEENNADVVAAGHALYNQSEEYMNTIHWTYCDDFIAQQLGECDSSHYSAYIFKREFIIDIPHRQEYGARDDRMFIIEVALKEPKVAINNAPTLAHRIHSKDKLQKANALGELAMNLFLLNIFKKNLHELEITNRLTQRRKKAACHILWPLSHWIAKTHLKEALEIVKWIYELNPDFQIPEKGSLGWMYKHLGFKKTEQILKYRRLIRYGLN